MGFQMDSVEVVSRYTVATTLKHISGYSFCLSSVTDTVPRKRSSSVTYSTWLEKLPCHPAGISPSSY